MSEKLISASTFDGARLNTALARDQIAALEQDLIWIAETLGGTLDAPIERHPTCRAAMAELDQAKLDLARIEVRASLAGTVTKPPKIGQHVEAGLIVMALVVSGNLWIEANWRSRQSRGPFERIYMPPSTESGGAWMFRSSADPVGGRHDNERSADRSKCSFQERVCRKNRMVLVDIVTFGDLGFVARLKAMSALIRGRHNGLPGIATTRARRAVFEVASPPSFEGWRVASDDGRVPRD